MKLSYFAVGAVALTLASSAHAVVLGNGGFGLVDNQALVAGTEDAVVYTPVTGINGNNDVRFVGEVDADAWKEVGGNYTFYYRFINSANSLDAVHRLTMTGFTGFTVDAFYLGDLGGDAVPWTADRSNDGNTVGFTFAPRQVGGFGYVDPGTQTYILGIRTNATNFTLGSTSVIDGAVATTQTFAPAVPEPASLAALGIGAVAFFRKRRK